MKNITVSLPDDIYRQARIKAAERDTSVSALVREYLKDVVRGEDSFTRLKRLEQDVLATVKNFRAGDRLTRDEVHDRRALR